MKISEKIRKKRIQDLQDIYQMGQLEGSESEENLFKNIKDVLNDYDDEIKKSINKTFKNILSEEDYQNLINNITDKIYNTLSTVLSKTLTKSEKIFTSFNRDIKLDLKDLIYNKDKKTLQDRIEECFSTSSVEELIYLLFRLSLILDTEIYRIIIQSIYQKTNVEYVEIIGNGNSCEICSEFCDGEVYPIEEIELPPYHPGCQCEAIFYEASDLI